MQNVSSALKNKVRPKDAPVLLNGHPPVINHVPAKDAPSPETPAFVADPERLRSCFWKLGETKAGDKYTPLGNHAALAMVNPRQGFAHWRIQQSWIDTLSKERGPKWQNCRLILRLYDVTFIDFNGFNAHQITNIAIHSICGHQLFQLPRPGTMQLAEVGFELRGGEFIPAARSAVVAIAPEGVSRNGGQAALFVDQKGRVKDVPSVWEHQKFLTELRKPRLKSGLRIAAFAFASSACGKSSPLGTFVSELSASQARGGHEVHVFLPRSGVLPRDRDIDGVHYHGLDLEEGSGAIEQALNFARAAELRLHELAPFDLYHLHEWMTGLAPWVGTRPTILSLMSTEKTRLNNAAPTALSLKIQNAERALVELVNCVLTPPWLQEKALAEYGTDKSTIFAFPMEGRLLNEWNCALDAGGVKQALGFGGMDRLLTYVGPLNHEAGLDLLIEALPIAAGRVPNLRLAIVGAGPMHDSLARRAYDIGKGHCVKMMGEMGGVKLTQLLRVSDALILPSRRRIHMDEAVVELARRAGKAVVTTHGGPSHLVKHEENGIITYDNSNSMVWALDRVLGDFDHTQKMGENGRRGEGGGTSWPDISAQYLQLCAERFPELTETKD